MNLLAIVLLLITALYAEKPAAKKASASQLSLKALIHRTLSVGATMQLEAPSADSLGYTTAPLAKEYIINESSLDSQYSSLAILDGSGKKANEMIVSSTTATEMRNGYPVSIDGYTYRYDLTGKLISGFHAKGVIDELRHDKLDANSPVVIKRFNQLLQAARSAAASTAKGK